MYTEMIQRLFAGEMFSNTLEKLDSLMEIPIKIKREAHAFCERRFPRVRINLGTLLR